MISVDSELDKIQQSLLACIVGTVSTIDLLNLKMAYDITEWENDRKLYEKALEDHCAMTMYKNLVKQ